MTDHPVAVTMRRYVEALLAGDMDGVASTLADEHRFEDRRLALGSVLDKAGNVEQARVISDLRTEHGSLEIDVDVIETRGDRLALIRQVYGASGYSIPVLAVMRIDDRGLNDVFIVFAEGDLEGARGELDSLAADLA